MAPLARFIMAMTSAFLLVRSATGFVLALADFFAGFGGLAGLLAFFGLLAAFRFRFRRRGCVVPPQWLDRGPDPSDCLLAIGELTDLGIARNIIPDLHQPGERPVYG